MAELTTVQLWTDGACSGNGRNGPSPGGWAAILAVGPHTKKLSDGEPDTTNNRMEILAVLEGLRALDRRCHVQIHTDSQYVIDACTRWMPGWRRRAWKTSSGDPVKNRELLEALDVQLKQHQVEWVKVKGHSGNPLNELADQMAVAACERYGGSGKRRSG